eukprot:jgi/Chrzof1/8703/Cz03g21080.t1
MLLPSCPSALCSPECTESLLMQDVFKYLDVLVYVEATIYGMDEENEQFAAEGVTTPSQHTFQADMTLREVLEQQGLMDDNIKAELDNGQEYWRMERILCSHMLQPAGQTSGHSNLDFTLADVIHTHENKSFDYRVLHLLLYKLLNQPCNHALLDFLKVDEMLVDIGDDLVDYEDDVIRDSFNIYRGYIHLFGEDAQMKLVQRISQLEHQRDDLLRQLPSDMQDSIHNRHKQAATGQGSDKWIFPKPVYNEVQYRRSIRQLEGA